MIVFLALLTVGQLVALSYSAITCRNQENQAVEWFSIYKVPKLDNDWEEAKTGGAFLYQDALAPGTWKQSKSLINETNQLLGYTLNQLYSNNDDSLTYLMYNENSPADKKSHEGVGHSKGFTIFDETSGIWVTHSVPYFPPQKSQGYSYPSGGHNANIYGQTLFCMTFPASELNKIAGQLWHISPHIYEKHVPAPVLEKSSNLKRVLAEGDEKEIAPSHSSVELAGTKGTKIMSFAKNVDLSTDMYAYMVAPKLETELLTVAWQHGGDNLPSTCSTPTTSVRNVKSVALGQNNIKWSTKDDHANWAVSSDSGKAQWTCFGDLSRQFRSFERSGGVICVDTFGLWTSYRKAVSEVDTCDKERTLQFEDYFGLAPTKEATNTIYRRKKRFILGDDENADQIGVDGSWDVAFLPGYSGTPNGSWPFQSRRWLFHPHHPLGSGSAEIGPLPPPGPVAVPAAVPVRARPVPVPVRARPVPIPVAVPAAVPRPIARPVPVAIPVPDASLSDERSFEREWARRQAAAYNSYLHSLASHERRMRAEMLHRAEMRRRWEEERRRRIAAARQAAYQRYLASRHRSAERFRIEDRKWLNHEDSYENTDSRSAIIRNMGAEG